MRELNKTIIVRRGYIIFAKKNLNFAPKNVEQV